MAQEDAPVGYAESLRRLYVFLFAQFERFAPQQPRQTRPARQPQNEAKRQ